MNIAQYLQLPLSYCNYVKKSRFIWHNTFLIQCLQFKDIQPQFIINCLIDKASVYSKNDKIYHIYTVVIFHVLAKPLFQKELLKHSNFLLVVLKQLDILLKSTNIDDDFRVYLKKTFVVHKLILKKKLKKKLYFLLYVRSVFINFYFTCLKKRYAFGNCGYIESKNNFENIVNHV
jgi:hypothetical protein